MPEQQQPTAPATGAGGTTNQPQGGNQPDPAQGQGAPATGGQQQGPGADNTDWKSHAKEWERRAKENAAARKELDDLKAAQMTEQQKLEARAAAAEAKAAALEKANLRHQVAAAKGLPAEMADRLQGDTREEMEADAATLLAIVKPSANGTTPARPDLGQGARGANQAPSADDWIRGMARRGR